MSAETTPAYQVLARKYRPQSFDDLIGQEAMVRTLTNAFASGRIAHAFMLTGVRGVGKTTTARLLARALNFAKEGEARGQGAPSMTLDPPGVHCAAIAAGGHPDVMELDAASRTGVNDIREILDGVRYAPLEARFKVYVIDEVHMLSTNAFNALLKTLEEPPAHAKFIFATTEIRKVPVTVLSRCQRFDLRRVGPDELAAHLAGIAAKEGTSIAEDGLRLIVRAAEGSVRDALSLLDQAIVQGEGGKTDADAVREMLGLADRARTFDLFEAALTGRTQAVLTELDGQIDAGADPIVVMRDLLDHCHDVTRAKALGEAARFADAADHVARVRGLAESVGMGWLSRAWQMLLKGHEETRAAPDARAAAEMALIRMAAAAGLPGPEEAAKLLRGETAGGATGGTTDAPPPRAPAETAQAQMRALAQAVPVAAPAADEEPPPAAAEGFASLADVAARAERERDMMLKSDIERFMRPVAFEPGRLTFQPTPDAPADLAKRVSRALQSWTGARWLVSPDAGAQGGETVAEARRRARAELFAEVAETPAVAKALALWPGAEIVEVRELARDNPTEEES